MDEAEREHTISEQKELFGTPTRLWCKDAWREFPVYEVPVKALALNVDNRRFAAERKLVEAMLGRQLDPETNPDDEKSIIAILLDSGLEVDGDQVKGSPMKDTEALKQDWLRRKQESPFWIRPNGAVHNGNRRLAVIKRLQTEGGHDGLERVQAIILEEDDVNEEELFKMEQREQLTENLKVRYTDINLLLALRDAATLENIDWGDPDSIKEVAGRLQLIAGDDKTYALIQLNAIKYMDAYLEDYLDAPGEYQRLLKQVERFRDVGKMMDRISDQWPDDATDMLRLAFAAIQAGNPHQDIRALRKLFIEDREAYQALLANVTSEEEAWRSGELSLGNPDLTAVTSEDDDDDGTAEETPPVVPNYPKTAVRTLINNALDRSRVQSALPVVDLLIQAQSRLDGVSFDALDEVLEGTETRASVRQCVEAIIQWADAVKEHLN